MDISKPLDDKEFEQLAKFLARPEMEEQTMDLAMVEGLFCALAVTPRMIQPSEWLRFVWDLQAGQWEPTFRDAKESQKILGYLLRHYNYWLSMAQDESEDFEGLFDVDNVDFCVSWSLGFITGLNLDDESWAEMIEDQPILISPVITLLAHRQGDEAAAEAQSEEELARLLPKVMVLIRAYWAERRRSPSSFPPSNFAKRSPFSTPPPPPRHSQPKPGRNEPCPCGSGKKFKRCCGAMAAN